MTAPFRTWIGGALALGLAFCGSIAAQTVHLQVRPQLPQKDGNQTVSRCDFLLSQLAFQNGDGTWLEARKDWFAFVSGKGGHRVFELTGVPAGKYKSVRFLVGLDQTANAQDPNQFPPGHALHPANGLQWEWQGGYIFLALEGLNRADESGFSYHLARSGNAVPVTVPLADFELKKAATIRLDFDVSKIPGGLPGNSTHSRDGDPVLPILRERIESAFSLDSIVHDVFQAEPQNRDEVARVLADPGLIPVTRRFPKVEFPADNPLTEAGIELGRQLFFDPILSKGETQSCATCHEPARSFSDGKAVSTGVSGAEGRRSSMPLFNLVWHETFFWDGRAKSLREQVLMPITDPAEMGETLENVVAKLNADPEYPALFHAAFDSKSITPDAIARALEQFLLTLVSQDSKFDRAMRREVEFTPEERRGLELFVTEHDPANGKFGADCFHCHGGNLFRSKEFSNNGLNGDFTLDAGLAEISGDREDFGRFKVPSLRNIELTAPYMHDGRFATLEEVIGHYDSGVKRSPTLDPNLAKHPPAGLNLSDSDKAALISFLKTLTDPSLIETAKEECGTFSQP
ncbi:MAG: cytochrome C peroxidase [Verrucomicrobiales bacterium]|nr:cytochrome C peroxidase [Verrucomicrobiales bacterium]